jgi:hypothetical protein
MTTGITLGQEQRPSDVQLHFVGFEVTSGRIGSVLIQDADLNGTGIVAPSLK